MGAQKELSLLSTNNFCFGWEIRTLWFNQALLSGSLVDVYHAQIQIVVSEGVQLWKHNFFFMWGGRIKTPPSAGHHRPAAKRHLNGVSLACRRWPYIECWLSSFVILRGSGPVLLRNPIFFIFQGGPDPLSPLLIRTCAFSFTYSILPKKCPWLYKHTLNTLWLVNANGKSYTHQRETTVSSNGSLQLRPFSKWKLLLKERICSQREQILSFMSSSF